MLASMLLREARARTGLTQSELGARVRVPGNEISRWERGEVGLGFDRLAELIRGCGLELDVALRPVDDSQVSLMDAYHGLTPDERLDALHRRVLTVAQLRGREERFDPGTLLRTLSDAGVRFIVIGGVAAALHGAPYPTYNLDVVPAPGVRNSRRLARALDELNANEEPAGATATRRYVTRYGQLQVVGEPAGTRGFADILRGADAMPLTGTRVLVAGLADVVRSKEALGRADDRAAISALRQLALRS